MVSTESMNLSLIMLLSVYVPNHVVNFVIITELLKWIYRIGYEFFWTAYPKLKFWIRHCIRDVRVLRFLTNSGRRLVSGACPVLQPRTHSAPLPGAHGPVALHAPLRGAAVPPPPVAARPWLCVLQPRARAKRAARCCPA